MNLIKVIFLVAVLAILGGCAGVPANPGDQEGSAAQPASSIYHEPSLGLGIGVTGGGRGHNRGYGYR